MRTKLRTAPRRLQLVRRLRTVNELLAALAPNREVAKDLSFAEASYLANLLKIRTDTKTKLAILDAPAAREKAEQKRGTERMPKKSKRKYPGKNAQKRWTPKKRSSGAGLYGLGQALKLWH